MGITLEDVLDSLTAFLTDAEYWCSCQHRNADEIAEKVRDLELLLRRMNEIPAESKEEANKK